MPTLDKNISTWGQEYDWIEDGDEWRNQAEYCKMPYELWKESIANNFIYKYIGPKSIVVEIGCGHGRWSESIVSKSKNLILVDLNQSCIDYCKKKFSEIKEIKYFKNDGKSLPFVDSNSVDFVFSYDCFVHVDQKETISYLNEFKRILKKDGVSIIHHPGRKNWAIRFGWIKRFGLPGRVFYRFISTGRLRDDGWRSDISKEFINEVANRLGLSVEYQIDSWGNGNQYNCKRYRDYITKITK